MSNKNYRVSGDFLAVTGLFNPKNGRIFLAGFVTNEKSMDAVMYEVDSPGLKIEELLRTTGIKSDFARAEECLTNLDWEVAFSE